MGRLLLSTSFDRLPQTNVQNEHGHWVRRDKLEGILEPLQEIALQQERGELNQADEKDKKGEKEDADAVPPGMGLGAILLMLAPLLIL